MLAVFCAPAGISPIGDKLRLPGSSQKKYSPAERRGNIFGAPAGISPNGDKLRLPGSDQKKYSPAKRRGNFFGAPAGIRTPDTLLKRQVLCLLSYWGISV